MVHASAKKPRAERPEFRGLVDCVITFPELLDWFEQAGIDLAACEESRFDEEPEGDGRYFPLVGGSIRAASLHTELPGNRHPSPRAGSKTCGKRSPADDTPGLIIEPLFCPQGCVNGPAMPGERNAFDDRGRVLEYAQGNQGRKPASGEIHPALRTTFQPSPLLDETNIDEDKIRKTLAVTGKAGPEDQLDCGACGYASCRDKAIAVINGMAEVEMCIPYMKRLAERRTDKIIETSPNGIVILNEHLNILSMNPAFRKNFMCSEAVCGQRISYLMDPDPFERLATGKEQVVEVIVNHDRYNLVCHELLYAMPEEGQYVGIFVNVTHSRNNKEQLEQLRSQTVVQARAAARTPGPHGPDHREIPGRKHRAGRSPRRETHGARR